MFIIYVPVLKNYRDIAEYKSVFSPVFLSDTLVCHIMNGHIYDSFSAAAMTEGMSLPMSTLRKDICMMMTNSAVVRQQHTVSEMRADMVRHDRRKKPQNSYYTPVDPKPPVLSPEASSSSVMPKGTNTSWTIALPAGISRILPDLLSLVRAIRI